MIVIEEPKTHIILDPAERSMLIILLESVPKEHNLKPKAEKMSQQIKDTKNDD